jgi:hypothetical protein
MKYHSTSAVVSTALAAAMAVGGMVHVYHETKPEPRILPDAKLTPGGVLPVTKEEICVKGYAQKVRNVPEHVKRQVYLRYGIQTHKPGEFEIDHEVSLELGGNNELENLWPQPYEGRWNAHMKDALENKLHQMVCEGTITLEEAQREISTNWIEAYEKYISN